MLLKQEQFGIIKLALPAKVRVRQTSYHHPIAVYCRDIILLCRNGKGIADGAEPIQKMVTQGYTFRKSFEFQVEMLNRERQKVDKS